MNEDQDLHNLSKKTEEAETRALSLFMYHIKLHQDIKILCINLIEKAEKTNDVRRLLKIRELVLESYGGKS